ncbi:MAG: transposase [Acidobacteriota bacterium]
MRAIARVALEKKWQGLIRDQQQSELSVSAFCRKHGFSDQSFYNWRKRLAGDCKDEPVRFALVEANASGCDRYAPLELILATGDRLRIAPGADAETLRVVLHVLRERR